MEDNYSPNVTSNPHIQTPTPVFSPGYLPWSPYAISLTGYPLGPEDFPGQLTSPTTTTNSSDSAAGICSPSESSSSVTDEQVVPINNHHPMRFYQPKSPEPTPCPPITPVSVVPVRTPTAVPPYFADHSSWSSRSPSRSARSQSQSRPSTARRRVTYKSTFSTNSTNGGELNIFCCCDNSEILQILQSRWNLSERRPMHIVSY